MATKRMTHYFCDGCGNETPKEQLKKQKVGDKKGELCAACIRKLEKAFDGLKPPVEPKDPAPVPAPAADQPKK